MSGTKEYPTNLSDWQKLHSEEQINILVAAAVSLMHRTASSPGLQESELSTLLQLINTQDNQSALNLFSQVQISCLQFGDDQLRQSVQNLWTGLTAAYKNLHGKQSLPQRCSPLELHPQPLTQNRVLNLTLLIIKEYYQQHPTPLDIHVLVPTLLAGMDQIQRDIVNHPYIFPSARTTYE